MASRFLMMITIYCVVTASRYVKHGVCYGNLVCLSVTAVYHVLMA